MIPTSDLNNGDLRLLEVDNRIIVSIQTQVRVLVTAADVLLTSRTYSTWHVWLFATHSNNPLVMYKAKILVLFLPCPLSYDCNDFGLLFLYTIFSSHIVHEHACIHTCAHTCIAKL